jgi:hypothetical protein
VALPRSVTRRRDAWNTIWTGSGCEVRNTLCPVCCVALVDWVCLQDDGHDERGVPASPYVL